MEEWRDIKGFEGLYKVSNLGRIKSLVDNNGKFREKILSPGKTGNGYLQVYLYKNRKRKKYAVHRLILSTFNPVADMENLEVNHVNEKKDDNRLENLEWLTSRENCNYGTRNKRVAEKQSITIVQLSLDGKYVRSWKSSHEAERVSGFNAGAINRCCKNKYLREGNNIYKGFRWCYLYSYIGQIDPRIKKVILFGKEYYFNN